MTVLRPGFGPHKDHGVPPKIANNLTPQQTHTPTHTQHVSLIFVTSDIALLTVNTINNAGGSLQQLWDIIVLLIESALSFLFSLQPVYERLIYLSCCAWHFLRLL